MFLLLKFIYKAGHTKLTKEQISFLALTLNVNTKTIHNNVKKLRCLKWLRLNTKTKNYSIVSFDSIRKIHQFRSRASIEAVYYDVFRINALLGGAIYTYLHKDFWRKVRKKRSVRLKGRTYHSHTSSFNYKLHEAPISVYGVSKIFNISTAKASRLKNQAKRHQFINVRKNYKILEGYEKFEVYYSEELPENFTLNNNKYALQGIDHILPNFSIRKRKKLKP